ncbi:DNA polymerase III subunit alpha [Kangiella sp. HZ709]|uniref:DNA polymerase III subunit alpha n=1 Tax=Kangiella sp. HZ709 TaxID=2666328 RepID=UPI0012AF155C|nr:DNA polymerase III subunit alpha [Kangiella sp. HZ709]MRX28315.1 DNA polymerase III subunit alpha [Kangiella sp. HZ709]
MSPSFVHLKVHTEYSMVDGLVRVKPLISQCVENGHVAIAMTDQMNMCGLVKFYSGTVKSGVKPIVGADLLIQHPENEDEHFRVTALCMNQEGYQNLKELISKAYLGNQLRGLPLVKKAWLPQHNEGLIILSGAREGDVGKALLADNMDAAAEYLGFWNHHFEDRFYLELQRTGRPQENEYIHQVIGIAQGSNTPVVATNDVRFIDSSDFGAHEARVCINQGRVLGDPRRPRDYSNQQYLRSADEMIELFSDIPEAIENTVEIAKRCNLDLMLGKYFLPDFPIPEGMTIDEFFAEESRKGLEKRLDHLYERSADNFAEIRQPYDERLQIELDVINEMGFPGYFLIVADFIQWSKNNGVPVGPGRGSGAGSLVAYALDITDLDPLEYDLLFERFLNPERISMPDFDVDFCMEGRDKVIDYVAQTYGRNSVSQIITFGTMAAKAVIRDVGRVLSQPYGFVDKLAKLIPFEVGMTLEKAWEQEPEIPRRYEEDDDMRELWDLARKLEGITRNAGKHAGGVVIAPNDLTEFAPLYCDETGSNIVTQFDKDDVESAGLVKFDFLGLRTLTIIDWALETANRQLAKQSIEPIDISRIDTEDPDVYQLLQKADTTAVFQLESRGMKDLIKRLQPSRFEDIIALVALFRPGPLQSGMVDDFIARKHKRQPVSYPHPDYQHEWLKDTLEPTYGIILYQEQVMQIAQILSGYSLGGADILRRAMGKKKLEEMEKQRAIFKQGAIDNGVDGDLSMKIFDLVEKFAGYGFNKSHSAAYALVAYQTAWLKTHHPAAFMAAVMSSDMDNTDKVVTYVEDAENNGLVIRPPDVNEGQYRFSVDDEGNVIYGIGAIKGVGEAAIESIVKDREANGPYTDLFDFCSRIDLKKANRRVLESLIKAGALDKVAPNRATLMASLDEAIKAAEQFNKSQEAGQDDLFGSVVTETATQQHQYIKVKPWTDEQVLQGEKETLGLYLTGHPIERYLPEVNQMSIRRLRDLQPTRRGENTKVSGLIVGMRVMTTKRGDKMAILTLDDKSGRCDVAVYSEAFETYQHLLSKDKVIVVEGEARNDEYSGGVSISAKTLMSFEETRERYCKKIQITISDSITGPDTLAELKELIQMNRDGACPFSIKLQAQQAQLEGVFQFSEDWCVQPSDSLVFSLKHLPGCVDYKVVY